MYARKQPLLLCVLCGRDGGIGLADFGRKSPWMLLFTAPWKEHCTASSIIRNLRRADLGGFLMFFVPFAEEAQMI
jgi:hypothetical protein